MSELTIADRIKNAIIDNGGYQRISEATGISKSTLARMASGQTEPKLKDVIDIAKATGVSLNYIAYGMTTEDEEERATAELKLFKMMQNTTLTVMEEMRNQISAMEKDFYELERDFRELKGQTETDPKAKRKLDTYIQNEVLASVYREKLLNAIHQDLEIPAPKNEAESQVFDEILKQKMSERQISLSRELEPTQPRKSK